jgi:hypothetical protein
MNDILEAIGIKQGNGWMRQGWKPRDFNKRAKTKRRRAITKASRKRNRPVKRDGIYDRTDTPFGRYLKTVDRQIAKFQQHLDNATRIVNGWPKWKRDILGRDTTPTPS